MSHFVLSAKKYTEKGYIRNAVCFSWEKESVQNIKEERKKGERKRTVNARIHLPSASMKYPESSHLFRYTN